MSMWETGEGTYTPRPRRVKRRSFLKWIGALGAVTAASGASAAYAFKIEPGQLSVEKVPITLTRLPSAFEGLTIALLCDLHLGPYVTQAHIANAIQATNAAKPDLIVLGGDMVNFSHRYIEPCADLISRLNAPLGVYAVMGNHDYWVGFVDLTLRAWKRAGVTLLRNQPVPITRGRSTLHLIGIDDWWLERADLKQALDNVPRTACKIALMHEPDFADYAAEAEIDLQLSGHSHGGQVRVPGIGPLILPKYGVKYPMGLARVGNFTQVYTSRGVGVLPPAVRFNCPPEVSLIRLTSY